MEKKKGIHFYVSIVNYNSIIRADEKKDGRVNHFIHALDTFFSSIEQFGKKNYPDSFVIEKITGARLHMYVVDSSVEKAFQTVADVSVFAYKLSLKINYDIDRYRSLPDFQINVGASYGKFYEFEFLSPLTDNYSELTSIGYAPNIAAKIQAKTAISSIGIAYSVYSELSQDKKRFFEFVSDSSFRKYELSGYYSASLKNLKSTANIVQEDFTFALRYADKRNISDIEPSEPKGKLSFASLTVTNSKMLNGIPLFCDVRGFSSQFEKDDSNLDEMARKTRKILNSMYEVIIQNDGIHVQFQGDREFSVFHNYPNRYVEKKCFKTAVLAAMRLIDAIKPYEVKVGIGEAFGTMFATRIGARGEKDNIVLGQTVVDADMLEDQFAGENQIAITADVFEGLKAEDDKLSKMFMRKDDGIYVSSTGFRQYMSDLSSNVLSINNEKKSYNPAWGQIIRNH